MNEKELEKILKALANKRRILILKYLKRVGKASVGEVSDAIKLSFKATSKHLMILSNMDIVDKEQISLTMFYFLPKSTHPMVSKLLSII
jgi:DNA-binding transcriptional ArsR family regulator